LGGEESKGLVNRPSKIDPIEKRPEEGGERLGAPGCSDHGENTIEKKKKGMLRRNQKGKVPETDP